MIDKKLKTNKKIDAPMYKAGDILKSNKDESHIYIMYIQDGWYKAYSMNRPYEEFIFPSSMLEDEVGQRVWKKIKK